VLGEDAAEDRVAAAEAAFAAQVAALEPDVVVDMICFTVESCRRLVEGLAGSSCRQFLHTGTIWVHGNSLEVPVKEGTPAQREPMEEYGMNKNAIEAYLLGAGSTEMACTILHAGHIVGKGWAPLNPQGHFNPAVRAPLPDGTTY
jgi:hypothetical protein